MRPEWQRESIARIALLSVLCLALVCSVAQGQSGRKQKKAEVQPPVQGVNQPETRVIPEPEVEVSKPKDNRPGVIVASDMTDIGISNIYPDIARQACIVELRDAQLPDIQEAKNQNRADAIKKAKEAEVYVVLLELRVDTMTSSSSGRYSFELRYTLYEPKTGKVMNSGAGYPASLDSRSPTPPGAYDYAQRQVELMGRDAGRKAAKFITDRQGRTPLRSSRLLYQSRSNLTLRVSARRKALKNRTYWA